tara:strand:- start:822 stop:1133 length:312 start_codon:yes stop_codon:yes gene_type:complete
VHIHDDPTIKRHNEAEARLIRIVPGHQRGGSPFKNPDNPTFGSFMLDPSLNPSHHSIAVHCLMKVSTGNVYILIKVVFRFWREEAKAPGVYMHPTNNKIHFLW